MAKLPKSKIMLDTRRANVRDQYPVVLYLYHDKKKKLFPVGYSLTQEEYENCRPDKNSRRILTEFEQLYRKFQGFEDKARIIISGFDNNFSIDAFDAKWNEKEKAEIVTAKQGFMEYIAELKEENREGTALTYQCALIALDNYSPDILFREITPEFLKKFEKWMRTESEDNRPKNDTTIAFYMRNLRTIYNRAISNKILSADRYPFKNKNNKTGYEIPSGEKNDVDLEWSEIEKIKAYKAIPNSLEEKAKDFWLFIYYANGMNNKDVCLLQWKNISEKKFTFRRAKTKNTTKGKHKTITVTRNDHINHVISKYGIPSKPDDYVFDFVKKGIGAEQEKFLIHKMVFMVNKGMEEIAKDLEINKNITGKVARRAFATRLIKKGNPIYMVSGMLGHESITTTQIYVGEYTEDELAHAANQL